MPEQDLENLLGGFATDTLTPEERTRLYQAALHDQQLFNALADEHALKELLADPAVRRRLLQVLQQPGTSGTGRSLSWQAWFRRPAGLAFAGGLAAAIFAIAFGTRIFQESFDRAATPVATEAAKPVAPELKSKEAFESPNNPVKKEALTEARAHRSLSDNTMPQRKRGESDKQAPLATRDKTEEPATPSADRRLAAKGSSSATVSAPPAAPVPMQAPAARKKSARALFYGEEPMSAEAGGLAQENERAMSPLAESAPQANRLERKMDQVASAGKGASASAQLKPLGLRYSFVTHGSDGQSQEVNAATAARSKEPVRIAVEATQDGYLQILQNLGSAGTRLWWPPQETGKISLKLLAGKREEIPMPPPAENRLLTLIIRLSTKPFGPLTMQEVGMLDRFSANLLTESVSPGGAIGTQEQATYVVSQDSSTAAQLAVEIPINQ